MFDSNYPILTIVDNLNDSRAHSACGMYVLCYAFYI